MELPQYILDYEKAEEEKLLRSIPSFTDNSVRAPSSIIPTDENMKFMNICVICNIDTIEKNINSTFAQKLAVVRDVRKIFLEGARNCKKYFCLDHRPPIPEQHAPINREYFSGQKENVPSGFTSVPKKMNSRFPSKLPLQENKNDLPNGNLNDFNTRTRYIQNSTNDYANSGQQNPQYSMLTDVKKNMPSQDEILSLYSRAAKMEQNLVYTRSSEFRNSSNNLVGNSSVNNFPNRFLNAQLSNAGNSSNMTASQNDSISPKINTAMERLAIEYKHIRQGRKIVGKKY